MFVQKASHLLRDFWRSFTLFKLSVAYVQCFQRKKKYIDSVFSNIGLLSRFIKNKMFVKLKGFNVINFSVKSKILKKNITKKHDL